MLWYYLVFAVLYTVVDANTVYDGQCPAPTGVENYDGSAWAETWYVISVYSGTPIISGSTCPFSRFTPSENTYILQVWVVVDSVQYYYEGIGTLLSNLNNGATFNVSIQVLDTVINYSTVIVATDYTNYAVIYNCIYDDNTNTHRVFPWIISRTKVLEGASETAVEEFIANNDYLDSSLFITNDFSLEACSFASTVDISNDS